MSYEINTPTDFTNNGPVELTLTNTTATGGVIWSVHTAVNNDLVFGETAGTNFAPDIIHILPGSVAEPFGSENVYGNERIGGYAKCGGITNPLNTTAGDLTGTRFMLGSTDTTLTLAGGIVGQINGGLNTIAVGTSIGVNSTISANPSSTAGPGVTYVGNQFSLTTGTDNSITGTVVGARGIIAPAGSGDIVNPIGLYGAMMVTSNRPSTHGLLTVAVGSGGSGYTVGDILTVTGGGGSGGTVTVLSVDGLGAVTSIAVAHPGTGYTVGAGLATTGGTGTGATVDLIIRGSTSYASGGTVVGIQAQAFTANGGFATATFLGPVVGVQVLDIDLGSGPMSAPATQIGIDVRAQSKATATTIGIDIKAQTGGAATNNIGLRIATPTGGTNNFAQQFVASTVAAGGISFGTDTTPATNLYRTAAGRLQTDAQLTALHFLCGSAIPTAVAGTGAGTGPTITVTALSTDMGMQITVLTGTAPAAAGNIFVLTYATAFPNALTAVVFSPRNTNAAALNNTTAPFISAEAASNFTFRAGSAALTATTTYIWNFHVRN